MRTYDPIALRDKEALVLITDYIPDSVTVFHEIRHGFSLPNMTNDPAVTVPPAYIKFVVNFFAQVSQAIFECHSNGLVHGNFGLGKVLVTKKDNPQVKGQVDTVFKITNFEPWVTSMFPLYEHHTKYLGLLQA